MDKKRVVPDETDIDGALHPTAGIEQQRPLVADVDPRACALREMRFDQLGLMMDIDDRAFDAGIRSRVQADAKTALAWSAMSTVGVMVTLISMSSPR